LTAKHCVGNLEPNQIAVITPLGGLVKAASSVNRHPSADLAIIETGTMHVEGDEVKPFEAIASEDRLGADFYAYGYPEDVLGEGDANQAERLFKGHFQRFLRHNNHVAGEMSIPSPLGLSGGPLFRPFEPCDLLGMAIGNKSSYTTPDSAEVEMSPGLRVEKHVRRMVEYGIALMLADVADWIHESMPAYQRPS
jgi:hypothetical protein